MAETEVSVSEDTTETETKVKILPTAKVSKKKSIKATRGTLDKV